MKKYNKLILIGGILLLSGLVLAFEKYSTKTTLAANTYEVKKVIDGDTLEILKDGKIEKVRLIGIDTPEILDPRKPVQCFGKEASDNTKALLSGKQIKLEFDPVVGEKDKYGRLLAYVWRDGELVNLSLLKSGYAHEYTYRNQNYKYQSDFKNAEKNAKSSSVGLWSPQTCNGITK
jgi:micrococcal nuclease